MNEQLRANKQACRAFLRTKICTAEKLCLNNDGLRRRRIIPIIRAELRRREHLRNAAQANSELVLDGGDQ